MKALLQQAIKFIGLSGIGWLLDFTVYAILGQFSEDKFICNCISSWVGVTFVFIFSTRAVFKSNGKISLSAKYLLYILYQCVLIFFISKLLADINTLLLEKFTWEIIISTSYLLAKILVTPITMILNFFVMKGIVEKM